MIKQKSRDKERGNAAESKPYRKREQRNILFKRFDFVFPAFTVLAITHNGKM